MSPYKVTQDFEQALCEYAGSRFAVAVNSCTAALLLACEWFVNFETWEDCPSIPRKTYCSVPMAIRRAGFPSVRFRDEKWRGAYQLEPYPIWDCARRFTYGMYVKDQFQCISFSSSKILGIEQGGAILHDNE
ncbi:MAG: DegT/DnrJ/EryC1/StrS family aminotransferase, partial [Candidatus Binatia bacterium]|nr:DegT/DnrJ/EryC1/StrS family aminotransferase [Candidatus Binatia bacterium]